MVNKYAYVILQIEKNEYISASINLAFTLKRTCTTHDIVILIDQKITKKCKSILMRFFDKIIIVEKISRSMAINKLLGYNLDEYEKIILIDADSIVLKSIDFIFSKSVPALLESRNGLGKTGLILIKPDKDKMKKIKKLVQNTEKNTEEIIKNIDGDINYLSENILSSNSYNKNSYGIQYNENKPFILENEIPLKVRSEWNHFKMWFYFFKEIINNEEEIRENSCISKTIILSKNYLQNIVEFIIKNQEIIGYINKNAIKKIYELKSEKDLILYHKLFSISYKNRNIIYNLSLDSLPSIIKCYNYLRSKKIPKYEKIENLIKSENKLELENFLNFYVRVKNNIYLIVNYKTISDISKYDEDLPKGTVIYEKNVIFESGVMLNVLFYLDKRFNYKIREEFYKNKICEDKYCVSLKVCKNSANVNFEYDLYGENTFIFTDPQSKINVSSFLLNKNSVDEFINRGYTSAKVGYTDLLRKMFYETLKKWIYNNYNSEEIEKIIVKLDKTKPRAVIYEYFDEKKEYNLLEILKTKKCKKEKYFEDEKLSCEFDGIKYLI